MLAGLKHFAVVGLGFALVAGWLLTLVVNSALGAVLAFVLPQLSQVIRQYADNTR
jgi:hypothetical protein